MPPFETEPRPTHDQFNGNENVITMRPMDSITRYTTAGEAYDMVKASALAVEIIEKEQPSVVFFPQRGAGPVRLVVEEMLDQLGADKPEFVDLPIGTSNHVDTHSESGLSKGQKRMVIKDSFEGLAESGVYEPGKSKMMILDEVQKGGTISQASKIIKQTMKEHDDNSELVVLAIQDSRGEIIGTSKSEDFRRLSANEIKGIKTYVIPANLFTVDKLPYLDTVVTDKSDNKEDPIGLDNFETLENTSAHELFRVLTRAYMYPDEAEGELRLLKDGKLLSDLGWISVGLQAVITDAITDPRKIHQETPPQRIHEWWSLFIRKAQEHKSSHR